MKQETRIVKILLSMPLNLFIGVKRWDRSCRDVIDWKQKVQSEPLYKFSRPLDQKLLLLRRSLLGFYCRASTGSNAPHLLFSLSPQLSVGVRGMSCQG